MRYDILKTVMAKKLRIKDKLLLGLALAGDLYFEIFEPYGMQIKKLKGFLPPDYKATNFANTVSRMLRSDQIEKVVKNGESYLRLSSKSKNGLTRDFSFFKFAHRPWDRFWRVVFYDIPETEKKTRVALHRKLLELGFGQLQESVFITPFDLAEDLREFILVHNLGNEVFVSVSRRLYAGDERALTEKVWKLSQINEGYEEWLDKVGEIESGGKKSGREELYSHYTSFLEILKNDPCLPKELLPGNWLGEKSQRKAKKILQILLLR